MQKSKTFGERGGGEEEGEGDSLVCVVDLLTLTHFKFNINGCKKQKCNREVKRYKLHEHLYYTVHEKSLCEFKMSMNFCVVLYCLYNFYICNFFSIYY